MMYLLKKNEVRPLLSLCDMFFNSSGTAGTPLYNRDALIDA